MATFKVTAVILGVIALLGVFVSLASAEEIFARQATLDDTQGACLDAGGTITSWHFIINQIHPSEDAPAFITVEWNGDTEDFDLDRVTGRVAHYTVTSDDDDHTSIASATAEIYDGWSGNFNLSSVECGPPLDACTEFEGRTVIVFDTRLGNAPTVVQVSEPVTVDIAPGTYAVTLQSFDTHSATGGQGQEFEQWFARFTTDTGDIVDSDPIDDLPDTLDELNQQVGTVTFDNTVTEVVAVHLLAGGFFPTPESVSAVCVALDPITED